MATSGKNGLPPVTQASTKQTTAGSALAFSQPNLTEFSPFLQNPTNIYSLQLSAIQETQLQRKVLGLSSHIQGKINSFVTFILQEVAAQGFDLSKLAVSKNNVLSSTSSAIKKLRLKERKLQSLHAVSQANPGSARASALLPNMGN